MKSDTQSLHDTSFIIQNVSINKRKSYVSKLIHDTKILKYNFKMSQNKHI